jgi:hypothetical protein
LTFFPRTGLVLRDFLSGANFANPNHYFMNFLLSYACNQKDSAASSLKAFA